MVRRIIGSVIVGVVSLALTACIAPTGVVLTIPEVVAEQSGLDAKMAQPLEMSRIPADTVMPTGQSVVTDCQEADAGYPYQPYDWPEASATLVLEQSHGMSTVAIDVSNVRPNMYYTVWLRLLGTDADGVEYGRSPLTGIAGTPLLPTSELSNALAATGEGKGRVGEANGFFSDENGNGSFSTELDFPILNGAYPFQKFEGFDAEDERYPLDEPRIHPVAIVGAGAPFTLRVVSHCTDGVGHGLLPGPHEGWFQWKFDF